jgi:hypothetical protein
MQVLPEVLAKERFCKIKIDFSYFSKRGIRQDGSFGYKKRKDIYNSSMVPVCVFMMMYADGILNPHLGASEFYLEYGDFDVNITAPANHIVVGSGELVNPTAVYSSAEQTRLAQNKTK